MSVRVPPKGTRGSFFPHPRATIEFYGDRRVDVEARTLAGAELDAAWKRLAVEAPEYPKYLEKTDRQIPVLRLKARTDQPRAA